MSTFFGLDIAPKKTGIAIISDNKLIFSSVILTSNFNFIKQFKKKYEPIHIFIGLPIHKKEEINSNYNYIKQFVHSKRDILKPFSFVDESFTTQISSTISKNHDEYSAYQIAIIGSKYFNFN